jgi:hypothetical protein
MDLSSRFGIAASSRKVSDERMNWPRACTLTPSRRDNAWKPRREGPMLAWFPDEIAPIEAGAFSRNPFDNSRCRVGPGRTWR